MNKKILLITLICTGIFIVGCSNKKVNEPIPSNTDSTISGERYIQQSNNTINELSSNNSSTGNNVNKKSTNRSEAPYKITKSVYKEKNVTIYYPQINSLGDDNKQGVINELIKKGALAYIGDSVDERLTTEINYEISLAYKDLFSIKYNGVEYFAGAAHPGNVFYTTNLDMNNVKILRLDSVVMINENFVDAFKKGKYVPWGLTDDPKINKEREASIIDYINKLDDKELIASFKKSDYKEEMMNLPLTSSYLTKDGIGVSINVPHVMGDHVEYEIKYTNIKDSIQREFRDRN